MVQWPGIGCPRAHELVPGNLFRVATPPRVAQRRRCGALKLVGRWLPPSPLFGGRRRCGVCGWGEAPAEPILRGESQSAGPPPRVKPLVSRERRCGTGGSFRRRDGDPHFSGNPAGADPVAWIFPARRRQAINLKRKSTVPLTEEAERIALLPFSGGVCALLRFRRAALRRRRSRGLPR